jgi:hypothetical protein
MVVTGLEIVAFPAVAHGDVNVTEIGTVAGAASTKTGTATELVP